MKGIYLQPRSPYYWFRYYDQLEKSSDVNKKRKSLNTKIPVTKSDWERYEQKKKGENVKYVGTPELRKLTREFQSGLARRAIEGKSGVKLIKKLKLSEGYAEFKLARTVPGSKKQLKDKTLLNYTIAVDHMIKCCGDKLIHSYGENHYVELLYHFEAIKIPAKKIKDKKGNLVQQYRSMSTNSRSIYTRSLHSLWNFFVDKHYTEQNIIEAIEPEEKDPDPIPLEDMVAIINYFKNEKNSQHWYWLVYFMLLTGCRPSSAIVQLKEDIDFKRKKITIRNVKAGERKNKNFYQFPLYNELAKLMTAMKVKHGDAGRLFEMYPVVPENYTWPLSFWKRKIKLMVSAGLIERPYTLKQIRPTLASFLINVMKMDIYRVKKLLDHANIKITDKNYVNFNVNAARKELDEIELDTFSEEDF